MGVVGEEIRFATSHDEVRSFHILTAIRDLVLPPLALFGSATGQTSAALRRNRIQFLNLHHVFEDEVDDFRALIEALRRDHQFLGYTEAVERIWRGEIDAPYIAFTFDDGIKNCLRAAEILEEFGIKAIFFLNFAMTGECDPQKIQRFCLQQIKMPPVAFLSWEDAETLLRAGHEIGSHTVGHPNLALLSEAQLKDEIGRSFELLKQRFGVADHFSWPYGRFSHFSAAAARIVFEAGFRSCASAERGCHVARLAPRDLCIRRTHVVAKWPISNTIYWLARYSRSASVNNSGWPPGWRQTIRDGA